ncbi:MAG: hypothetical protein K2H12_05415, partial [Acetatifactor sp.]|nr:hypothetical protein [Acetatifactor sp.]
MISLTGEEEEQTYTYDRRGNLTAVSRGEELLKAFTFDAANRMTSALQIKDGVEKRAEYRYNALGNRIGQDIYSRETNGGVPDINRKEPQDPEQQIRYTLDLTRQYHNLLISEDSAGHKEQAFYWDGNVAAMEEEGHGSYYLQDDLGSPMLLSNEDGEIRESYAFDEFGQSLHHTPEGQLQPFGYTGYQMETAGGLYFAQARRYDAGTGRFVSEDRIPGFMALPHTMNRYSYCWNQPMEHVDLDGRFPWFIVPLFLGLVLLGGCSYEETKVAPEPYTPVYDCERYNTYEYKYNTNCYAYAFGMLENPITGEKFPSRGNQPGLLSNDIYYQNALISWEGIEEYDRYYLAGTPESNQNLVNVVKNDASTVGLNFAEYEEGMEGGRRVALVVRPENREMGITADYHWYVYDEESGQWYNKHGQFDATNKWVKDLYVDKYGYLNMVFGDIMTDYILDMEYFGYELVGEYYITRQDGACFE